MKRGVLQHIEIHRFWHTKTTNGKSRQAEICFWYLVVSLVLSISSWFALFVYIVFARVIDLAVIVQTHLMHLVRLQQFNVPLLYLMYLGLSCCDDYNISHCWWYYIYMFATNSLEIKLFLKSWLSMTEISVILYL